ADRQRGAVQAVLAHEVRANARQVALVGAGQSARVELLIDALDSIAQGFGSASSGPGEAPAAPTPPSAGESVMTPRQAYFAASELVSAHDAVGRVSADLLAAYPPGVPNVVPGERLTATALDFLRAVTQRPSGYVRGAVDPDLSRLRVVRDTR
ncbi:MAG TPA: amino acid decarboxylase, partial [Terrimesophilobacter sp.]|nr:amino acid decarboxylase [Terrimesophilobacter sp.]